MVALLIDNLGVVCPSCDFLNVVHATKCLSCTSSFGAAPRPAPAPSLAAAITSAKVEDDTLPGRTAEAAAKQAMVQAAALSQAQTVPVLSQVPVTPAANVSAPTGDVPPGMKRAAVAANAPAASVQPPSPEPVATAPSSPAPAPGPRFGLTVLAGPARGQRFRLGVNGAQVGRARGVILFPDDPFISPLHATLSVRDGQLWVRDEASTSGVWVSLSGPETLAPGAQFALGLRLLRYCGSTPAPGPALPGQVLVYGAPFPGPGPVFRFEEVLLGGRSGRAVVSGASQTTFGQSGCDWNFPQDEAIAPKHAEVSTTAAAAVLRDLSGGLGVFVRVQTERALKQGDRLRMGQQTLQVELLP